MVAHKTENTFLFQLIPNLNKIKQNRRKQNKPKRGDKSKHNSYSLGHFPHLKLMMVVHKTENYLSYQSNQNEKTKDQEKYKQNKSKVQTKKKNTQNKTNQNRKKEKSKQKKTKRNQNRTKQ